MVWSIFSEEKVWLPDDGSNYKHVKQAVKNIQHEADVLQINGLVRGDVKGLISCLFIDKSTYSWDMRASCQIWGFRDREYDDDSLLGCDVMLAGRTWETFAQIYIV